MNRNSIKEKVLQVNEDSFEALALEIFRFQVSKNDVYRSFVNSLSIDIESVRSLEQIPFLPISAFKSHSVKTGKFEHETVFESSGTTKQIKSRHFIKNENWYRQVAKQLFEQEYGEISDYCVLGLLPSYLERSNSSLVNMVGYFIDQSKDSDSGFYLDDFKGLHERLVQKQLTKKKTILIGVSFALLDLSQMYVTDLSSIVFMETGGMKGRSKELPRMQFHEKLKASFNLKAIHSEYGMTELLSQAYSKGDGYFDLPKTMKVFIADANDPLDFAPSGKSGIINIIDLANVDSCSFIQTEDIGKKSGQQFQVLGRLDKSELRGCSLLYV